MPVLHEPEVSLDAVKLWALSLSSLELDVAIRVGNVNPLGVTLRELTFTVRYRAGNRDTQIAAGNTGRVKIPARGNFLLHVPVRSQNAALIGALATFVTHSDVQVTIEGKAVIDCLLFGWSVPFTKTMPVTMAQVANSLAGKKK